METPDPLQLRHYQAGKADGSIVRVAPGLVATNEAGEEEGMKVFADWMRTVTPSLRSVSISTDDGLYLV